MQRCRGIETRASTNYPFDMLRGLLVAMTLCPVTSWMVQRHQFRMPGHSLPATRKGPDPVLRQVSIDDLPLRPPMAPAVVVVPSEVKEPSEGLKGEGLEELMSKTRAGGANFDNSSTLVMERLKGLEDTDAGLSMLLGSFLNFLDSSGTVRRRLWTRADFMHIHAVSGAYFLFLGIPWLVFSHWVNAQDTSIPMETSSWFLTSLLVSGLVNALSAIPMSRFRSNKLFDLNDMKANGFTFGGTGLTCMCLYIAWWFGGSYPDALRAFDVPIFFFWTVICVGTTANWELMLQQNFESNEAKREAGGDELKVSSRKRERDQKAILYRLASWPNLTQLLFMYSIPFGGSIWLQRCESLWPMQNTPMFHYGLASALGYALSMFSETLRDRKLVTLETDLAVLVVGFSFPMISVLVDALTYGCAVTINPLDYWVVFGAPATAVM